MTRENHWERWSPGTDRESGTTQRLAERLMEAVAGIGYNREWCCVARNFVRDLSVYF